MTESRWIVRTPGPPHQAESPSWIAKNENPMTKCAQLEYYGCGIGGGDCCHEATIVLLSHNIDRFGNGEGAGGANSEGTSYFHNMLSHRCGQRGYLDQYDEQLVSED